MKRRVVIKSKKQVGELGERLVEGYIRKRGYEVLAKNFRKPWGELDIVCSNKGIIHVIEVKTAVNPRQYRLEEQVHPAKMKRIFRTTMSFLLENDIDEMVPWQLDAFFVSLKTDKEGRLSGGSIRALANVIGG
jgi:putative endonuclease